MTKNPNDKQEMAPALAELAKLPETLGAVAPIAADPGYFSRHNVEIVDNAGIEPLIAGCYRDPPSNPECRPRPP